MRQEYYRGIATNPPAPTGNAPVPSSSTVITLDDSATDDDNFVIIDDEVPPRSTITLSDEDADDDDDEGHNMFAHPALMLGRSSYLRNSIRRKYILMNPTLIIFYFS